jgi:hypothetical protein
MVPCVVGDSTHTTNTGHPTVPIVPITDPKSQPTSLAARHKRQNVVFFYDRACSRKPLTPNPGAQTAAIAGQRH